MHYLTAEDVLRIHSAIIDETGGSHGIRDHAALSSLEHLPRQEVFGKQLYPTVFEKGAVYVRNIIFGHPFIDGNKRTAVTAADVFLQLNGYHITVDKGGVEKFALLVIKKHADISDIAAWLKKNSTKKESRRKNRI